MPTVTEKIALAREQREAADKQFREALRRGRAMGLSWSQLATLTGMSRTGIRYLVNTEHGGETNGD